MAFSVWSARTIRLTFDSPMDGHGRNACVSLEVNDADAYHREWSTKVQVLRPPRDEDWDARTFDLLDPFGNTIFVMGPIPGRQVARSGSNAARACRSLSRPETPHRRRLPCGGAGASLGV